MLRHVVFSGDVRAVGRAQPTTRSDAEVLHDAEVREEANAHARAIQKAFDDAFQLGMEEGRKEGFDAGVREGLAAAEERIRTELELALGQVARESAENEAVRAQLHAAAEQRLGAVLGELERNHVMQMQSLEIEAARLAFSAVCTLLGDKAGRAAVVADLVHRAFDHVLGQPVVKLRMHPDDWLALNASESTRSILALHEHLVCVSDSGLAPGSCRVVTSHGTLDAGLFTQLENLRAAWAMMADGAAARSIPPQATT
jgi:flagellar assembly protein FliH